MLFLLMKSHIHILLIYTLCCILLQNFKVFSLPFFLKKKKASSPEAISEKINEGLRLNDEGATEDALKIFSNVLLVSPSSASSNFNMAVLLGLCDWPRFSVDYVRKVILSLDIINSSQTKTCKKC